MCTLWEAGGRGLLNALLSMAIRCRLCSYFRNELHWSTHTFFFHPLPLLVARLRAMAHAMSKSIDLCCVCPQSANYISPSPPPYLTYHPSHSIIPPWAQGWDWTWRVSLDRTHGRRQFGTWPWRPHAIAGMGCVGVQRGGCLACSSPDQEKEDPKNVRGSQRSMPSNCKYLRSARWRKASAPCSPQKYRSCDGCLE